MPIRVVHGDVGAVGALAVAAGRGRGARQRRSEDLQAQTAIDVAQLRRDAIVQQARARNAAAASRVIGADREGRRRQEDRQQLLEMELTEQAERIGREPTLNDREKRMALEISARQQKLLKPKEPSPQQIFDQVIVADPATGIRYYRNKNGEYRPLETGEKEKSRDFGKVIERAIGSLGAAEKERADIDDFGPPARTDFSMDEIAAEARRLMDKDAQNAALAEMLRLVAEKSTLNEVRLPTREQSRRLLEKRPSIPRRSILEERPPRRAQRRPEAQEPAADPLKLPGAAQGSGKDRVIDLGKLSPIEIQAEFQGLTSSERREFVVQMTAEEEADLINNLPKIQRKAVRRAADFVKEQEAKADPSDRRIAAAKKKLDQVFFKFEKKADKDARETERRERLAILDALVP